LLERNKEYDEFGPWIYEIDDENDVPAIFRSYYSSDINYLLLFKVPRMIERRSAAPGMDLYDYLIGACETYLHIFKRIGKTVTEKKVDYSSIIAIEDAHSLLYGKLTLLTIEQSAIIEYNTVSKETISKLINIIENKISFGPRKSGIESIPVFYSPDRQDSLDMHLFNLINQLQQVDPGIKLAAYQQDIHTKRIMELKKKLKISKLRWSNTAFLINDKELIILERQTSVKKKKDIDQHYYSFVYIPFQNINYVSKYEFDNELNLMIIEFSIYNHKFSYVFENGNNKIYDLYRDIQGA
jgi:hypothetical protein